MSDEHRDWNRLSSFLWAGYFFEYENTAIKIRTDGVNKQRYDRHTRVDLVRTGIELFRAAISSSFQPGKRHLVPLSGGLDSRAILACLLEHTEARQISTFTFGTPGTFDYDIGNHVAQQLGTEHTSFDLTRYIYTQRELEDISSRVDRQTVLFHHPPVWEIDTRFRGCEIWSGYLGDPLAGSHLLTKPSHSIQEAQIRFLERNRYVKSLDLRAKDADLGEFLIPPCIDKSGELTLDEQLDFANRQVKFVAPHVLMRGFNYRLPFLHQPWVDFMLSVDNRFRHKQTLYKDILRQAFSKAFSYKTKTNRGLPLTASAPQVFFNKVLERARRALGMLPRTLNYLDFERQIRHKADLRQMITTNVVDLGNRGIVDWIDVTAILNKHMLGEADYSDALLVLASLEIHMKTGPTNSAQRPPT